jgi:phage gp29-like protein
VKGKLTKRAAKRTSKTNFANAVVSDQGPTNPKFGNVKPSTRTPPTSGMTGPTPKAKSGARGTRPSGDGSDYFRAERLPAAVMPTEPDMTMTPERVQLSVRMRFNPIKGLTFPKLVAALDAWDLGFFRQAGVMWDKMEKRDYQLKVVAPKRKKSVARHGYDILTVEQCPPGLEGLANQQREFLKNFFDNISVTTAMEPDETGGLALLIRQMADAIGKRYAVHEIVWQPQPDGNLTAKFIFCPIWWFEGTRGKLRFLESEFQVYGKEMLPGEWLVTVHDGLMEACSIVYLFKHLPIKSWLSYLDKFGMPGLHGKTDAAKGSKEWEDLKSALVDFSEEFTAVTGTGAEINLVEAKGGAGSADSGYAALVEKMDRALTQLWRGADLGTNSSANANGASLQGDETEILETDDARVFGETLTAQVCRHALAWKFGHDAPQLAYITLRIRPQQDIAEDVLVDKFLMGAGAPLGVKATLERYNRPVPGPDDELLELPQQNSTGDNGGNGDKTEMANDDEGQWVTINGAHILIKDGVITKGPDRMVGSTVAEAGEYYHATSAKAAAGILKTGIKPTDKTLGFKAAFVGKNKDLAFAYGAGAAARDDDNEVAVLVVKDASKAGMFTPKGAKGLAYKPGTIKPEHFDRVEYYRKDAGKNEAPLRVVHLNKSEISNEASSSKSKQLLIEALLSEYDGINKRMLAVANITDAELQRSKLAVLLADLEEFEKNLAHDPAVANAIYKILAANVANGIADTNSTK